MNIPKTLWSKGRFGCAPAEPHCSNVTLLFSKIMLWTHLLIKLCHLLCTCHLILFISSSLFSVFLHTHTHILVARMHAQAHISWSLLYPLFVSNVIFKWLVCFPVVSSVPCLFVSVTACLIIKTCFPLFLGRIETSLDISEVHFFFFNFSFFFNTAPALQVEAIIF